MFQNSCVEPNGVACVSPVLFSLNDSPGFAASASGEYCRVGTSLQRRASGPHRRHDHPAPGAQTGEQVGFVCSGLKRTGGSIEVVERAQADKHFNLYSRARRKRIADQITAGGVSSAAVQREPPPSHRSEDPIMTASLRRDPARQTFRSSSAA